jgi:formylglycine-generating enzyme required for sulfatase activity
MPFVSIMRFVAMCLSFVCLLLSNGTPAAQAAEKTYTNSIGMEFVLIPAGSFMRGADKNFEDADKIETPQHRVILSKPFYLGKYEVTQEQWAAVMGSNPSRFKGRTNPVESVSWSEVQAFIERLNAQEKHDRYRLPTEAEWEYASKGGKSVDPFFAESGKSHTGKDLGRYAWFNANSEETHPVGQLEPNPWGLYDMHGNVWEWVQDWYGEYPTTSVSDPVGPSDGECLVIRGGSWRDPAEYSRSAFRNCLSVDRWGDNAGFRLALSPE